MKVVADTDILSIFAKINRLDILSKLFDEVIVPNAVIAELREASIDVSSLKPRAFRLTKEELKALKETSTNMGAGERECLVVARARKLPLATNEKMVHSMCSKENIGYFSLTRLLRFAILEKVISREDTRRIVKSIEEKDTTVIKDKEEIFK